MVGLKLKHRRGNIEVFDVHLVGVLDTEVIYYEAEPDVSSLVVSESWRVTVWEVVKLRKVLDE